MGGKPIGSTFGIIPLNHGFQELQNLSFWRDCVIEMIISIIGVFVSVCAAMTFDPDSPPSVFLVSFATGLYVFVLIEAFGHVQYAVMNPIIGVCFAFTKRISTIKAFIYTISQFSGCTLGAFIAKSCAPEEVQSRMTALGPGPGVTEWQAFVVEMIMSMSIVIVALGALDFDRRSVFMAGLPVGMGIGIHMMSGRNFSGGCTHPAIAFGLATASHNFHYLWIYLSGDYIGCLIGMLVYFFATYDKGVLKKDFSSVELKNSKEIDIELNGKDNKAYEVTENNKTIIIRHI